MENYAAGESQIRDVDVANESSELFKSQIQQQAATPVLGKENLQPELVLKLLRHHSKKRITETHEQRSLEGWCKPEENSSGLRASRAHIQVRYFQLEGAIRRRLVPALQADDRTTLIVEAKGKRTIRLLIVLSGLTLTRAKRSSHYRTDRRSQKMDPICRNEKPECS